MPQRCVNSNKHILIHYRHGVAGDESYDECEGSRDRRYTSSRSYQGGYTREGSGEAVRDTEAYAFTAGYGPSETEEEGKGAMYRGAHGNKFGPKQQAKSSALPFRPEQASPRRGPAPQQHALRATPHHQPRDNTRLQSTSCETLGTQHARPVQHATLHDSKTATLRPSPPVQNQLPKVHAQRALLPTPRKYRSRSASPPRGPRRGVAAALGR